VLDHTCGSGSLLLKVAAEALRGITIYGQEKDNATWALSKMNMISLDVLRSPPPRRAAPCIGRPTTAMKSAQLPQRMQERNCACSRRALRMTSFAFGKRLPRSLLAIPPRARHLGRREKEPEVTPSQPFKVALLLSAVVDLCVRVAAERSLPVRTVVIVRTPLPSQSLR